ncbi:TRAP transporter small permease subunit [Hwanghaeella grinnelliae]|uniref:TRAP transporter small permease protein n=2 Tax=Hwanghaeella grinnelliae TaxID=2500179 RepID=A0A437QYZ6_9PROT|nr:TRAP transporter small permease subunit [Hwanghaeella grinnelliae]
MVLLQFLVVVMRYVFGTGEIWLQEAIIYQHALVFMLGASYTLLKDGHVRVDIFYSNRSPRTKATVNLLGALFLLFPVMSLIVWASFPYVARSWAVLEGSRETSGIPGVFLLKSVILVFAVMMLLQGLSTVIRSLAFLRGLELPPLPYRDDEAADRVEV